MKRPTMLIKTMLAQASMDLDLSVERDVRVIEHRCKHEGLSFLTITLPKLSDALEQGIEHGLLTCPTDFSSHGRLPRLLGGFFRRVFARSGELLPEPDVECIKYIRQICRFFKKLKIPCSPDREDRAIGQFLAIEDELRQLTPRILKVKDSTLDAISQILWSQVFPETDPCDIVCKHGPGVTADRFLSNERNHIRYWYDRWESFFPADLHAYPNFEYAMCDSNGAGGASETSEGLHYIGVRDEPGVRVVFVPKTLTAPRVIAIEPSSMQYVQQGLLGYMVAKIESHRLTHRSVRFTDQSVNQHLARRSSVDRSLATLDLKDASDRVHFELVRRIFKGSGLIDYLEAARSLHATLPNGKNIILSKFASMGSAICFPVEACVFYTLIQLAFHLVDGRRPSSSSIRHYSRQIDIYGDDIIVPVGYTDAVVRVLESYGLKVNVNKSFRSSLFRESCGGDYYNGESVKPIYARELPLDSVRDWTANQVMSWVSTANQFYMAGQWLMAKSIHQMLESVIGSRIPRARQAGQGVFFRSLLFDTNLRYNPQICGWEQKRLVYKPSKRKDVIDGNPIACLLKWGITTLKRADDGTPVLRKKTPGEPSSVSDETVSYPYGHNLRRPRIFVFPPRVDVSKSWSDPASLLRPRGEVLRFIQGNRELSTLFEDISDEMDFESSVKRGGFKSTDWKSVV